jgi:hypothetical protein
MTCGKRLSLTRCVTYNIIKGDGFLSGLLSGPPPSSAAQAPPKRQKGKGFE